MRIGPSTVIATDRRTNRLVAITLNPDGTQTVRTVTGLDLDRARILHELRAETDGRDLPDSAPVRLGGVTVQRVEADGLWTVVAEGVELFGEDGPLLEQVARLDVRAAG